MLATLMPFICMGLGLLVGFRQLPKKVYTIFDWVTTVSLVVLMFTIGGNVGTNKEVIEEIGTVGFNCLVTCFFAIGFSVIVGLILEKTVLPLDKYSQMQLGDEEANAIGVAGESEKDKRKIDPILLLIPTSVLAGAFGCYFFMPESKIYLLSYSLWASLAVLYTSIGIGMGQNKNVFGYIKAVGFRVLYMVGGILFGSMAGGAVASLITGMPMSYGVIAASGVGYYSMTGATMLQVFGAEAGVYGFMVNVFREFFTVLLLPVLIRISKSSPIAAGGAGNMDTMLVPITRALGRELGMVTLVVGILLTFGVPVILPLLCRLF